MNFNDSQSPAERLFESGQLVTTPGALMAADSAFLLALCSRHLSGDWGEVCNEEKVQNDEALKLGNSVMSSYSLPDGAKVWIITEWDRSATTILLPCEY